MGCCTLSSCSSNKGPRILGPTIQIDQDVDRYSPWRCCCWRCCCCCCCCRWLGVAPKMRSGRPIKIKIIKFICCLNYHCSMRQDWTIAENWIRDMMKFYFCAQQFLELPFPFPNFKKSFFDSFQIFQIGSHMEGEGKWRFLIVEISTLVKTALKIYYSMLSPLAKPCFPNDKIVYTTMSSASISIEAEWRLSINDHHHHHFHHHHHCQVWSDVILLFRSWLQRKVTDLLNQLE